MRTPTKPWYRASKDAWYVEINGKQVRLSNARLDDSDQLMHRHIPAKSVKYFRHSEYHSSRGLRRYSPALAGPAARRKGKCKT